MVVDLATESGMTVSQLVNLLLALVFVYLASFVDQVIYSNFGVLPLFGQVACLAALAGLLAVDVLAGEPRALVLSRAEAAFIALTAVYIAWCAVSFVLSSQSSTALETLITRVKAALFILLAAPLCRRKGAGGALAAAALVVAVVGSALAAFDFFNPTFSSVPGRGAGFYENPNTAGFMLVALGVIASTRLSIPINYLLWAGVSIGVSLTFSRSGWVVLVVALAGQALLGRFGGGRGRFLFVGAIAMLLGGLLAAYVTGGLYDVVANSDLGRHLDPNTVARLGRYGAAMDDASALERNDALQIGLQAFYASPFLGHGIGHTFEWAFRVSTHNMYLLLLAEMGVIGCLLYVGLLAAAGLSGRGEALLLTFLFALASVFSHNMLDQPGFSLVLTIAATTLAVQRVRGPAPHKGARKLVPVRPASATTRPGRG
jgi:O-antigen ligase